jgi:hypothetical protein
MVPNLILWKSYAKIRIITTQKEKLTQQYAVDSHRSLRHFALPPSRTFHSAPDRSIIIKQSPSRKSIFAEAFPVCHTVPGHTSLKLGECYGMLKICVHTRYFDMHRTKSEALELEDYLGS